MHEVGGEFYGDVRRVDDTVIATKFFTIKLVPIWPLRSYYFNHATQTERGIPFFASVIVHEVIGIQCARLNLLSVLITYVRFVCLIVGVGGGFALLCGTVFAVFVSWPGVLIFLNSGGSLAFGAYAGYLTYAFTRGERPRDEAIRRACGRCLDVAADPARIQKKLAEQILAETEQLLMSESDTDVTDSGRPAEQASNRRVLQLLRTRAEIKCGGDRQLLEFRTDELLDQMSARSPQ
ncbi:MAG: hypothetical protein R3C10_03015 [Pirellulales bacterium]|nr:hypothetical protein [Planctomycetales bacterium]